jgi:hypothetical protein
MEEVHPVEEAVGKEKPGPLRIRIPSGVQCSSCEDFKVLAIVADKSPSPWTCGACTG